MGALQLLPLPPAFHSLIAPGSAAFWHPGETAANAVLGEGWRPISVNPAATRDSLALVLGLGILASMASPALAGGRSVLAAATLVGGGLALATYGVVARTTFGPLLYGAWEVPTVTPFGPFVNKNHFAAYVATTTLLGFGLALGMMDRSRRDRTWASWTRSSRAPRILAVLGVAAMLALAVLISQSRGGALNLALGAAVLSVHHSQSRHPGSRLRGVSFALGGAAVVAMLVFTLPFEARSRLATLLGPPDPSASFRLTLWLNSLALIHASPIAGHGLGTYADTIPAWKTAAGELRVEHAENDYLETLAEGGLIAGVLIAAAIVAVYGALKSGARSGVERGIAGGALASLTGLGVQSLVDFPFRLPACALLATCALALMSGSACSKVSSVRCSRGAAAGLLVALVALLAQQVLAREPVEGALSHDALRLAVAVRTPAASRARRAESILLDHLRDRPTDAEGWALLAWLRARGGRADQAQSLARHARSLDPQREQLTRFVQRLTSPDK